MTGDANFVSRWTALISRQGGVGHRVVIAQQFIRRAAWLIARQGRMRQMALVALHFAIRSAPLIALLLINGCNRMRAASANTASEDASANSTQSDTITAQRRFPFVHGVRVYVSAVNCEMNAEDATRVNALAVTAGLAVEVVFAGITGNDSSVVRRAQTDLGLNVPVRQIQKHEIEQYKSIGGAALPMALVVKGQQLKTIVTGESMPRTLSIVEAALSSTAPQPNNQSPEG